MDLIGILKFYDPPVGKLFLGALLGQNCWRSNFPLLIGNALGGEYTKNHDLPDQHPNVLLELKCFLKKK